jgi:hypothetical protein
VLAPLLADQSFAKGTIDLMSLFLKEPKEKNYQDGKGTE